MSSTKRKQAALQIITNITFALGLRLLVTVRKLSRLHWCEDMGILVPLTINSCRTWKKSSSFSFCNKLHPEPWHRILLPVNRLFSKTSRTFLFKRDGSNRSRRSKAFFWLFQLSHRTLLRDSSLVPGWHMRLRRPLLLKESPRLAATQRIQQRSNSTWM